MNQFITKTLLILIGSYLLWSCENNYPDSVFDSESTFKANPVITGVSPESAFAGVDTVNIIGENFSSNINEMAVYFNGSKGKLVSATPTLIRVIAANVINDSIKIQVRVDGALEFAETFPYKLEPILINYGVFDEFDDAYGIVCDLNETIYLSLFGKKVEKINQNLERIPFATKLLTDKTTQMKLGPGGYIYYVNGIQYLVRIAPDGKDGLFVSLPGAAWDLDFDANKDIYLGGGGKAIYKVTPDKKVTTVMQYPNVYIRAVRVYNNYLYVAGTYSGTDPAQPIEGLWRNEIITGSETLGNTELVFDFGKNFISKKILSMAIDEDGDIYLGTDADAAIVVVHPNGSFDPLYPGVLGPEIYSMTWGNGPFLYFTQKNEDPAKRKVLRLNMRKNTAPYFGRL